MENHNKIFTDVENYTQMEFRQLQVYRPHRPQRFPDFLINCHQETKIGKVMRHIAHADEDKLPRNADFNFKERAAKMVDAWQAIAEREQKLIRAHANGDAANPADQSTMSADVTMGSADANGIAPANETTAAEATTNGDTSADMKVDA
jgi:hypothetical protein